MKPLTDAQVGRAVRELLAKDRLNLQVLTRRGLINDEPDLDELDDAIRAACRQIGVDLDQQAGAPAEPEQPGVITMTSKSTCVRVDCDNFGGPLAECPKPAEVPCRECAGFGQIDLGRDMLERCPTCHGTGKVKP